MALYIIYVKRHHEDDSVLLGAGLILTGILLFIIGWIIRLMPEGNSLLILHDNYYGTARLFPAPYGIDLPQEIRRVDETSVILSQPLYFSS